MLITLLVINGVIILANLIYVSPPIEISAEPFPADRQGDIQKIKDLEQLTATGWANGNGAQLASAFTKNADYVTFNGQWLKGSQEITGTHQKLFDGPLKGSSLDNRIVQGIRFLNDDVAIVHVTGAVKQKGRKKAAKSRMSIQTLVAIKENEGWRLTSFHNARIRRFTLWDIIMMSLK